MTEDLVIKCVVTLGSGLIGLDKTPTDYLFNMKDYENMSKSKCLHTISKSFDDSSLIWISLVPEV